MSCCGQLTNQIDIGTQSKFGGWLELRPKMNGANDEAPLIRSRQIFPTIVYSLICIFHVVWSDLLIVVPNNCSARQ